MKFRFLPAFAGVLILSACLKPQAPAPALHYGVEQGAGSTGAHTVIEGDTLWSISKRYNLVMRDIAAYNDLAPPYKLPPGSRVRLPPPREYRVKPGDTLATVSKLFGTSNSELANLNSLQPPYRLMTHQILRLPSVTPRTQLASFASSQTYSAVPVEPVIQSELLPPPVSSSALLPPQSAPQTLQAPASQKAQILRVPEQRTPEAVKVAAQRNPVAAETPKRASSKFLKPVNGNIISGYGPKKNGLHNDGINIAAPAGTPVMAAENGVVVYAGNGLKGSGNLVLIRHQDRWMTAYGHMSEITVQKGDVIKRGQPIGAVGSTGSVDAPQLHFEVRRGTDAINPQVYLES